MEIKNPCIITPRLLPGLVVGEGFISIEYSKRTSIDGRTRYKYYIDLEDIYYSDESLKSGCGGGSLQEGLESLLYFLTAFAESRRYGKPESDNWTLFPDKLADWAMQNSDELSSLEIELEETENIIME